jgi:proteasome lid subunit RPN8/RPN11
MVFDNDSSDLGCGPGGVQTARCAPRLRLPRELRAILRGWAEAGYPDETCGLLIGESNPAGPAVREVRRAENLERSRAASRYFLDPAAFLDADRDAREGGLEVLGFWHSHPDSPASPSETDRTRAWEGYGYVIVSVDAGRATEVRLWRLESGTFQEGEIGE